MSFAMASQQVDVVRMSSVTNWSITVGVIAALLQFSVTTAVVSQMDHPPFFYLPLTLFGPFATFVVIAGVTHRRRFTFDETAGTMKVERVVFGFRLPDPTIVPLAQVNEVAFQVRWNGDNYFGLLRLNVVSLGPFRLRGSVAVQRNKFDRIRAMIDRARAVALQTYLPRRLPAEDR
jgi:hypothetical protein